MSQENELSVWGISKLFRRNLIVAVICLELAAIGHLFYTVSDLHRQKDAANAELVRCKEEAAAMVNEIRLEQIARLDAMLAKQEQTERELRAAYDKLKRLRK